MGRQARMRSHRFSAATTAEIYEQRLTEALDGLR